MPIPRPYVQQMYNLFHPTDPMACRIEPLLSAPFSRVPPINVSRYQKYPMGDGACYSLIEFIQGNNGLFAESGTAPLNSSGMLMTLVNFQGQFLTRNMTNLTIVCPVKMEYG